MRPRAIIIQQTPAIIKSLQTQAINIFSFSTQRFYSSSHRASVPDQEYYNDLFDMINDKKKMTLIPLIKLKR